MDPLQTLNTSRHEFEVRLGQITDEQWDLPTPCGDWLVRDLVNHMLLGTRMTVQLLAGDARDDVVAGLGDDLVGADPVSDFAAMADQMEASFAAPDGLTGTVDHPMGEIPKEMFIGFRVTDNAVHAWDLAVAIGADEHLNGDVVDSLWADLEGQGEMLTATGIFGEGPSGNVGNDAPTQTRLLDLMGRRPSS